MLESLLSLGVRRAVLTGSDGLVIESVGNQLLRLAPRMGLEEGTCYERF